jgi:hypothetical protein
VSDRQTDKPTSMWAVGFTGFAGFMMITIGVMHGLWGLSALLNDDFFGPVTNYVYAFDATTWGWVHLLAGILVFAAGCAIFSGKVWARTIAAILAVVSIIANFMALPYFPAWSLAIIALDVAVLWAVTAHGRDWANQP